MRQLHRWALPVQRGGPVPCLDCGLHWHAAMSSTCAGAAGRIPATIKIPVGATTVAHVIANAQTWSADGHVYDATADACMRCGLPYDSYLQGPVPCTALPPVLGPEEVTPTSKPEWRHGYCLVCAIELSPAMDGDGAAVCNKCSRVMDREVEDMWGPQ